jgi:hypothetical protein
VRDPARSAGTSVALRSWSMWNSGCISDGMPGNRSVLRSPRLWALRYAVPRVQPHPVAWSTEKSGVPGSSQCCNFSRGLPEAVDKRRKQRWNFLRSTYLSCPCEGRSYVQQNSPVYRLLHLNASANYHKSSRLCQSDSSITKLHKDTRVIPKHLYCRPSHRDNAMLQRQHQKRLCCADLGRHVLSLFSLLILPTPTPRVFPLPPRPNSLPPSSAHPTISRNTTEQQYSPTASAYAKVRSQYTYTGAPAGMAAEHGKRELEGRPSRPVHFGPRDQEDLNCCARSLRTAISW